MILRLRCIVTREIVMLQNYRTQRQFARDVFSPGFIALLACLTVTPCGAFPVDFVQIAPDQVKPTDQQEGDEKVDQPDKAVSADKAPAADKVIDPVAKPVKSRKGIVKKKAAVVAAGAAEAAEEVGEVLGNIIGGLFGRRGAAIRAQAQEANLDPNARKQFEAQYGRHFDQIVRTELHFVRIVCQPTREQYEVMENDADLVRAKAIDKFALIQQGRNRGNRSNDTDTRKPIAEGLLASVKKNLSPDQVSAYERELLARKNAYKDITVLVTAANLDQKLVLNSDQRTQVTKVLDDNWNPAWGSMGMLLYGGQYFPDVPDAKLAPILTSTQKKILRTVNQQSQVFFGFNIGMNQGVAIPDEQWDDEPVDGKTTAAGIPSKKAADEGSNSKTEPKAGEAKTVVNSSEDSE